MSETIISKRCPQCKTIKSVSEFYKCRTKYDGLQSCCKSCLKYYEQSKDRKAAKKRYEQSKKGKVAQKRHRQTDKYKATQKRYKKSEKGKQTFRVSRKRFYNRHPNYIKATNAVNNAIRSGKLPRPNSLPCHYCPKPAKQYHHWHGYAPENWLDVVPVCVPCHNKCRNLVSVG